MLNQFVKEYLNFSKKERNGIIFLIVLIAACIIAPVFYSFFIHQKKYDHKEIEQAIQQLKVQQLDSGFDKNYSSKNFDENNYSNFYEPSEKNYPQKRNAEVFSFDPNTASTADWQRLGLRDKTIATIQKYISKGGHFHKPEDIAKIWGLHPDDVARLTPYVKIEIAEKNSADKKPYHTNTYHPYKKPEPVIIDINSADTTAYISLPGIGSKLANRIIIFRDKLGGFYSVEQVHETFGLPDSTFQKIKSRLTVNKTSVKQININTATLDEIKAHPYLRYNIANAIVQFRTQHGTFSSVDQIKNIMIITPEVFAKVEPYLTVL